MTGLELAFVTAMLKMDDNGRFPDAGPAYRSFHPAANQNTGDRKASQLLKRPGVKQAIQEGRRAILAELIESVNFVPIANQGWRVQEAQRKYDQLEKLLMERAQRRSENMSVTGLETADVRGKSDQEVAVFDKDLVDAMRELREEVAKEMGQIVKRMDLTSGGKPINVFGLSDDELDNAIRIEGREITKTLPA